MSPFKTVKTTKEFDKDFSRLLKKYKTLETDLKTFIRAQLSAYHHFGQDNKSIVVVPGLGIEGLKTYKARKFSSDSLKGKGSNTGIRVIYTYLDESDTIILVEIYSHSHGKDDLDKSRIQRLARSLNLL